MRFWRIARSGQAVKFQYSADGVTWTTGRSLIARLSLDDISLLALAGGAGTAKFDNAFFAPANGVRLFGNPSGDLAQYVTVKVELGTGGSSSSCTGFTPETTIYDGPLNVFPSDYAHGLGEWFPSSGTQSKTYRFTATTVNTSAIQGKSATSTFTWEVQAGI